MKRVREMEDAIRELGKRRDEMLRTAPALSQERRAVLARFLATKFPVEAAMRGAATKRDELLNPHLPEIPASVELALSQQLQAAEAVRDGGRAWRAPYWRIRGWAWLRIFRSPLGAALTACGVSAAAILCVGEWGTARRDYAAKNVPQAAGLDSESLLTWDRPLASRAELFARRITIGPFSLNTSEPASLEASFASNRRIQFADGVETPLGLRLDLPLSATLMEEGLTRTP